MSGGTAVFFVSRLAIASVEFLLLGILVLAALSVLPQISSLWRRRIWLIAMFKPVVTVCTGFLSGFLPLPAFFCGRFLGDVMFPEMVAGGASSASDGTGPFQVAVLVYFVVTFFLLVRVCRSAIGCGQLIDDAVTKGYRIKPTALRRLDPSLTIPPEASIVVTPEDQGPMALGIRRPTVIIPESLLPWVNQHRDPTAAEKACFLQVLRHEIVHIEEKHNRALLLAHVLLSLFWFHPIAHLAFRRLRINSEYCCDEQVLASGISPDSYARTLMEIVSNQLAVRKFGFAMIGDVQPRKVLTTRMKRVLAGEATPVKRSPAFAIAVLVIMFAAMPRFLGFSALDITGEPVRVVLPNGEVIFVDAVTGQPLPEYADVAGYFLPNGERWTMESEARYAASRSTRPGLEGELFGPPEEPADAVAIGDVPADAEVLANADEEPEEENAGGVRTRGSSRSGPMFGPVSTDEPQAPILPLGGGR